MLAGRPGMFAVAVSHAVVAVVASAGCYGPTVNEGAPCAANGECPTGQTCDPVERRCFGDPLAADARGAARDAGALDDDAPVAMIDAGPAVWLDTFERADGDVIGNGWIEKSPAAWRLGDGHAVKQASVTDYRDNLVYRPAAEAVDDVTVQMIVQFTTAEVGYAQLFVRAQASTVDAPRAYDGYLMYVASDGRVVLGRQRGEVFVTTLDDVVVMPALEAGTRYRFTLAVRDDAPVLLAGRVERADGIGWSSIGDLAAQDSAPERIGGAGTVGFAGSVGAGYAYEEFARITP